MSFNADLLDIVCCPLTRAPLQRLDAARLARLNALIAERKIKNEAKMLIDEPLDEALVTRDGRLAYPVRDGIAVLLIEEGIGMSQCE
jgi:uncharacterized protein YbaR (Trm112 family)